MSKRTMDLNLLLLYQHTCISYILFSSDHNAYKN